MLQGDLEHTVLKFFRQLDCPRSLTCYIMVMNGQWEDLVSLRVDPSCYEPFFHFGAERFGADAQATEFLRKCAGLETGIDTASVALEGFYACEKQCAMSNVVIERHLSFPVFPTAVERQANELLVSARSWIERILGRLPHQLDGRFGPGATFESNRWNLRLGLIPHDKLQFEPSVTSEASDLVDHIVWQTALGVSWGAALPDRSLPLVRGNRFTTVPKDATKDRGICIEPGVNLVGQLAMGAALRKRLMRVGIDLDYGQGTHQALALSGSQSGDLCTIDLSNASDTVCRNLVKLLLPEDWYAVLNALRSHFTRINQSGGAERWVSLEKFSSMGNGFTFELETLIFASLCKACGGTVGFDTFVYGDDIIVPSSIAPDVLAILRYCGFTPNDRKTFQHGYFRESCGGDYFNGRDVRPYYLKELPNDPADWIALANGVWAASKKLGRPALMAARNAALDNVPVHVRRCRGPSALGDLVVHDDDESKWLCSTRNSIRYFRVWRPVVYRKLLYATQVTVVDGVRRVFYKPLSRYRPQVHYTAALMGLPSTGASPRGSVTGYRFGRVAWS
jgi:hypothetical protein